jgi:hypothetical protein
MATRAKAPTTPTGGKAPKVTATPAPAAKKAEAPAEAPKADKRMLKITAKGQAFEGRTEKNAKALGIIKDAVAAGKNAGEVTTRLSDVNHVNFLSYALRRGWVAYEAAE